jgi:hypothetical protein
MIKVDLGFGNNVKQIWSGPKQMFKGSMTSGWGMGNEGWQENGGVMLPLSQRFVLRCFKLSPNLSMISKHCGQGWVWDEHWITINLPLVANKDATSIFVSFNIKYVKMNF